jgi:hypothetical protein
LLISSSSAMTAPLRSRAHYNITLFCSANQKIIAVGAEGFERQREKSRKSLTILGLIALGLSLSKQSFCCRFTLQTILSLSCCYSDIQLIEAIEHSSPPYSFDDIIVT